MSVPLPEPHDLLVEQEAVIDAAFKALSAAVIAGAGSGATIDQRGAETALDAALDGLYGTTPTETVTAPLGKIIRDYANAARMQVVSGNLLLAQGGPTEP